jgi:acyl-CoA thioesterase-1
MRDQRLRRDSMLRGSDTDSFGQRTRKAACAYVAILAALLASLWFGASPVVAQTIKIVALGDSLTAGFGLTASEAFPAQLEAALKKRGHDVTIVNAGVSGDTSAGGLARIDWSIPDGTDAVILVLGANDMLRGLDPAQTRKALDEAVRRLRGRKIEVLIGGMRAAPNLGADYAAKFDSLYPELAKEHDALIYTFFLDGVAGQRELNLGDGIHPTAKGVSVVVERIIPSVESLIERVKKRRG